MNRIDRHFHERILEEEAEREALRKLEKKKEEDSEKEESNLIDEYLKECIFEQF